MILDDVEDAAIDALDAGWSAGAAPILKLVQSRDILIRGCQPRAKDGTFLQVTGQSTRAVTLVGNELIAVAQPLTTDPDVPTSAVSIK